MWETLPSDEIAECFIQNLKAELITPTSVNVTWTLDCSGGRYHLLDFTKLYVEHQEFLACEDKTRRDWRRQEPVKVPRQNHPWSNEEVK